MRLAKVLTKVTFGSWQYLSLLELRDSEQVNSPPSFLIGNSPLVSSEIECLYDHLNQSIGSRDENGRKEKKPLTIFVFIFLYGNGIRIQNTRLGKRKRDI
jgi:hypothetical protein